MNKRKAHRSIRERWIIEGKLLLETPAHFGNGDADALTDMPLLFDETSNSPLLPGTSIAGALRNFLRERKLNYGAEFPDKGDKKGVEKERALPATKLFGAFREDDDGDQSSVIVYDALGEISTFELRDGVKIDPETRTAEDKKKFDIQLLGAGTTFDLRFEMLITNNGDADELKKALATALLGLTHRQITLGARKRRGFGQCTVPAWKVQVYNLMEPGGLKAWLASERDWSNEYPPPDETQLDLAELADAEDKRQKANLTAEFNIDGTLLIRSGFGSSDIGPDTVHLHSQHGSDTTPVPIIPGTSWAGVLRHRALKIARTIWRQSNQENASDDSKPAQLFVDRMFGPSEIKRGSTDTKASRIDIRESVIEKPADSLVVTRVKIDRFTGGAYEGALFSEQPVIGKLETCVKLELNLRNPTDAELGLLLLLLKDLWTGDLSIGGESGIGRGRLKGVNATLRANDNWWQFDRTDEKHGVKLTSSNGARPVQDFVDEFNKLEKWTV